MRLFWLLLGLSVLGLAGSVPIVLLGNFPPGLFFEWLFRRKGLESAMIAHGAADVWLHAALPLLLA